jgi:alpha-tubulin suppressor-like RCC1 family protein
LPARAIALAVGGYASFALLETGEVMSWGLNFYGLLGLGESADSRSTPAGPLALGGRAIALSASFTHACALLEAGQIVCWGSNASGELGIGNTTPQPLPSAVLQGEPAAAVSVGFSHTCALFSQGRMKCWGYNAYGQLGLGDTLNRGDTPDTVPSLNPFIRL